MPGRRSSRLSAVAILSVCAFVVRARSALAHDTTAPVLERRVDPVYPGGAIELGVEGTVVLELFIDSRGGVEHVHVLSSPGHGLDQAAAAAARQFEFKPATADGAPVASRVVYEQKFVINRTVRGELSAEAPPVPASPPPYETVVVARGPLTSASSSTIRDQDFELRPRASPNDILRVVPGLVTAQHQGGGKADQIFLRGFDADHGTDVAVSLDGIPVNMPSHAHGQGYADLHFLIPEVLQTVEVDKGAYLAQFGDFDTAGAVNLVTRRSFTRSFVGVTGGSFDTLRVLGVGAAHGDGSDSFLAVEAAETDGPFDNPENLRRANLFAKSTVDLSPATTAGAMVTAYASQWIGSGQIPARLVGTPELPSRFGSLDPSEGGSTQRDSATAFVSSRPDPLSRFSARVYAIRYKLALFNDFTFFYADPVHGDEIEQDDARTVTGASAEYEVNRRWLGASFKTTLGAQARHDDAHVDLWNVTSQAPDFRRRLGRHAETGAFAFGTNDDERLSNLAAYLSEDVLWRRWLRTVVSARADTFDFDVDDKGESLDPATPQTSGLAQKALVSPKASAVLSPGRALDVYLNFGTGFHSNDARLAVRHEVGNIIPRAYEGEVGARARLLDRFDAAFALWYIALQSEIVFQGDAGTYSPSDPTRRYGLDVELRYRLLPWLFADADVALAHAEFVADRGNGGAVALAPRLAYTGGLTARRGGWRAALRVRGVGDRPVVDPSDEAAFRDAGRPVPMAQGYALLDAFAGWQGRRFELLATVENVLDTAWREAQLANRSCSRAENATAGNPCFIDPTGIRPDRDKILPDVHFTPGNPVSLMITGKVFF